MVRQIKVLEIQPSEEATRASDQVQLQSSDHVNKTEPEVAVFETTPETEVEAAVEATALEEPSAKPTAFSAHETKTKVIQQVTCQDCGKSMSAKTCDTRTRNPAQHATRRHHLLWRPRAPQRWRIQQPQG
jgi:hypothetical protein